MGKLTMTQLINQGITLAGKNQTDGLRATVLLSMNAWLRSTYKGWLWPYLSRKAQGIVLAQGAQSLTVGGGQGGVTPDIGDIYDPVYFRTSDYASMGTARVVALRGGPAETRAGVFNPSTNTGAPRQFQVEEHETTEGRMILYPFPIPEKQYLLSFDFKMLPANLTGSDVPRYTNDRTLLYAAKVCALEYMTNSEEYNAELEKLAVMVAQDYGKDAAREGNNDVLGLDPNTFK